MSETLPPTEPTPPIDDPLPETPAGVEARLAKLEQETAADKAERPARYQRIAEEARRATSTPEHETDIFEDIFGE